jgi:hypothetical protein
MPIARTRPAVIAKWILGQDAFSSQLYLVHTEYPAFYAKIGYDDEGILAPLSYGTSQGQNLYDFVWFDPFPDEAQFMNVMSEAESALDAHLSRRPSRSS